MVLPSVVDLASSVARAVVVTGKSSPLEAPLVKLVASFADYAVIRVLSSSSSLIVVGAAAAAGRHIGAFERSMRVPLPLSSSHPVAVAAREGLPQFHPALTPYEVAGTAVTLAHGRAMLKLWARSGIAVPLLRRDGTPYGSIGVLRTGDGGRSAFDRDDVRRLERAAREITAAHGTRQRAQIIPFPSRQLDDRERERERERERVQIACQR